MMDRIDLQKMVVAGMEIEFPEYHKITPEMRYISYQSALSKLHYDADNYCRAYPEKYIEIQEIIKREEANLRNFYLSEPLSNP
jgi:hypothetical protein